MLVLVFCFLKRKRKYLLALQRNYPPLGWFPANAGDFCMGLYLVIWENMKRSEIFFAVVLVPLDFCMLLLAFLAAYYLRNHSVIFLPEATGQLGRVLRYGTFGEILPLSQYLKYVLYIIPAMLAIFAATGLYAMRSGMAWTKRITRIFIGVSVGLGFILVLFFLRNDFFLPRATVVYAWVFCTLFVVLGRFAIRLIQRVLRKFNIGIIRLGVIGKSEAARRILQNLNKHSLYRLEARYDSLDVADILAQLDADNLDELIVVNEHYNVEDLVTIRNHCLENQVGFSFVPALFAELQSNFAIRSEVGLPAIEVRPTPLEGWGRVLKRLFDIIGSLFFIILFSPLYIIIAIWLKLASPGPLLYKQVRIGKDMRPITIWKFRSMHYKYCDGPGYSGDEALKKLLAENPDLALEWKQTTKLRNDPRVSDPGRFLRKTSLDELPQFFNVLIGSLSLVGPRPIVRDKHRDEVEKYGETARLLFTVKPGITGLWQVSGRNDLSFNERVQLDAAYIEHWNLLKDLWIIIKTVGVVFSKSGNGAY
jgi:exopolysaccharide biosynthesis polyprenyl glycosylphosphotransferase